jgi:hypothetical protein
MKVFLVEMGLRRGARVVAGVFAESPHVPFAPIRQQLLEVWRAVNRARRTAGLESVPIDVLPWKRRILKPFGNTIQQLNKAD